MYELKRYSKKNRYLNIIAIFLVLSIFIGIGYSYLTTSLSITGDITLEKYVRPRTVMFSPIIESQMDNEDCMLRYDGEVTDQVGITTEANNVYFNRCTNKRNIIFGGFCWQMIRTTETGGIKMIYNGEPVDGKCESGRSNHLGITTGDKTSLTFNSSYLYGSSYTYDLSNDTFTLIDTETATWSSTTYPSLVGKYTCMSSSNTCSELYYVVSYNSSTKADTRKLTIANVNYGLVGKTPFNGDDSQIDNGGYMYSGEHYDYSTTSTRTGDYSSTYTYDDVTGTYSLAGDIVQITDFEAQEDLLSTHHYTCAFSYPCRTIYYFMGSSSRPWWHTFKNGKGIQDVVDTLSSNNRDSNIKIAIEDWYELNMTSYTNKLEDTVYCNDRSIYNIGSYNPNGGVYVNSPTDNSLILFKDRYPTTNLACPRVLDQFTTTNNSAKLKYPVALLTIEEYYTLESYGLSIPSGILTTGSGGSSYTMSPYSGLYTSVFCLSNFGYCAFTSESSSGYRPVVTLKNNTVFASGSGSETDPWIVN